LCAPAGFYGDVLSLQSPAMAEETEEKSLRFMANRLEVTSTTMSGMA